MWSEFQLEQLHIPLPGIVHEKSFWDHSGLCVSLRSPHLLCIFSRQFIISLRIIGADQFDLVATPLSCIPGYWLHSEELHWKYMKTAFLLFHLVVFCNKFLSYSTCITYVVEIVLLCNPDVILYVVWECCFLVPAVVSQLRFLWNFVGKMLP